MQVPYRRARWRGASDGPAALFHFALQLARRSMGRVGSGGEEYILDSILPRADGASGFVGGFRGFGRFNRDVASRAQNIRVLFQTTRSLRS